MPRRRGDLSNYSHTHTRASHGFAWLTVGGILEIMVPFFACPHHEKPKSSQKQSGRLLPRLKGHISYSLSS